MVQKEKSPTLISLFTCGMGMDIGFEEAGFKTKYANDIEKFACATIRENRPQIACDEGDITEISSKDILSKAGLATEETDVVIGGPPCQSFSTAGMRKGFADKRGAALLEFLRVIKDIRPKFFVFENVPGLKSMALKHMSYYDRLDAGKKNTSKEQEYGTLFVEILDEFKKLQGYNIDFRILNAADYGVAQKRKRLILIGSRVADATGILRNIEEMSEYADPKKADDVGKKPWKTLRDVLSGLNDEEMECKKFPNWGRFLEYVPPGGCWVDLPDSKKKEAMGGAADTNDPRRKGKQGGRTGFYRRLSWDKPSPTLVTSPSQMATCICHPDELRPLSVKEYARIQGFPDQWEFIGTTSQKYRMIGEAVPIGLAKTIAIVIINHLKQK